MRLRGGSSTRHFGRCLRSGPTQDFRPCPDADGHVDGPCRSQEWSVPRGWREATGEPAVVDLAASRSRARRRGGSCSSSTRWRSVFRPTSSGAKRADHRPDHPRYPTFRAPRSDRVMETPASELAERLLEQRAGWRNPRRTVRGGEGEDLAQGRCGVKPSIAAASRRGRAPGWPRSRARQRMRLGCNAGARRERCRAARLPSTGESSSASTPARLTRELTRAARATPDALPRAPGEAIAAPGRRRRHGALAHSQGSPGCARLTAACGGREAWALASGAQLLGRGGNGRERGWRRMGGKWIAAGVVALLAGWCAGIRASGPGVDRGGSASPQLTSSARGVGAADERAPDAGGGARRWSRRARSPSDRAPADPRVGRARSPEARRLREALPTRSTRGPTGAGWSSGRAEY
jgi:hypothetical protein